MPACPAMDASFDRRPAGERAITRPTPATSAHVASRARIHRRRRTCRRERFEPCGSRAGVRSSANPMIGKIYGLVHSALNPCKRRLPAHGSRPDDEAGVSNSVLTATERQERAWPGPGRTKGDSPRTAPNCVIVPSGSPHCIERWVKTMGIAASVDRLGRRGAADPPGRRVRDRPSGSIAADAARVPGDAARPAGPR